MYTILWDTNSKNTYLRKQVHRSRVDANRDGVVVPITVDDYCTTSKAEAASALINIGVRPSDGSGVDASLSSSTYLIDELDFYDESYMLDTSEDESDDEDGDDDSTFTEEEQEEEGGRTTSTSTQQPHSSKKSQRPQPTDGNDSGNAEY